MLHPLMLSGYKDGVFSYAYGSINPCIMIKNSIYDDGFFIIFPDNLIDIRTFADACFLVLNITQQKVISIKYRNEKFFVIGKTSNINTADKLYKVLCEDC